MRRAARASESGVVLIEFALVGPLFCLLMFGVMEFGYAFAHVISIANATGSGARVGAATGLAPVTDPEILAQVGSRKLAMKGVRYVVIYRSTNGDGSVPASCLGGTSRTGLCNVYRPNASGGFTGNDSAWPSVTRKAGEDYLGVYMQSDHQWMSRLFGATKTLQDSGVMLLEPKAAPAVTNNISGEGPAWHVETPGISPPNWGGHISWGSGPDTSGNDPGAGSGSGDH